MNDGPSIFDFDLSVCALDQFRSDIAESGGSTAWQALSHGIVACICMYVLTTHPELCLVSHNFQRGDGTIRKTYILLLTFEMQSMAVLPPAYAESVRSLPSYSPVIPSILLTPPRQSMGAP